MSWTSPRTWVAGELETAAIFNPHVRDNFLAILSTTGLLTLTTAGTHTISAGAVNILAVRDTAAGATHYSALRLGNDSSVDAGLLYDTSSTYNTAASGPADPPNVAECLHLVSRNGNGTTTGGMSLVASNGPIRFYAGSQTTVRGEIFGTGGFSWGDTTDPGATNFRVAGTLTQVGISTFSAALRAADGAVGTPSYSFTGDTDTGMYSAGANSLGFATGGVQRLVLSSTANSRVSVATGAFGAGNVQGAGVEIGANSSGGGAAGYLGLTRKDSALNYLWVDVSASPGMLRISTSPPDEDGTPSDTSGTIVGLQASTLDAKDLLGQDLSPFDALATILRTPVKHFRYKGGSYSGTEFHGIIADWSPEFAMDPDGAHPNGRSFNPVSAFGYSVLAMQALDARLRALEEKVH